MLLITMTTLISAPIMRQYDITRLGGDLVYYRPAVRISSPGRRSNWLRRVGRTRVILIRL